MLFLHYSLFISIHFYSYYLLDLDISNTGASVFTF